MDEVSCLSNDVDKDDDSLTIAAEVDENSTFSIPTPSHSTIHVITLSRASYNFQSPRLLLWKRLACNGETSDFQSS